MRSKIHIIDSKYYSFWNRHFHIIKAHFRSCLYKHLLVYIDNRQCSKVLGNVKMCYEGICIYRYIDIWGNISRSEYFKTSLQCNLKQVGGSIYCSHIMFNPSIITLISKGGLNIFGYNIMKTAGFNSLILVFNISQRYLEYGFKISRGSTYTSIILLG